MFDKPNIVNALCSQLKEHFSIIDDGITVNEAETRAELIDPALSLAGWGKVDGSRVRREVIAPGRLVGRGKRSQSDIADYVLLYRGQKLAKGKTRAVNASIEGVDQVLTLEPIRHRRKKEYSAAKNTRSYRKSSHVKKPLSSNQLIPLLIAIIIGVGLNTYQFNDVGFTATDEKQAIDAGDSQQLAVAFNNQQSDIQVGGVGTVVRTLSDDMEGSRHQRFILKLSSGQTVLVAHNIDLAPRINSLRAGDGIEFYGEYEWNSKGGVLHWTHHDPRGNHEGGWLKHNGSTYQ